MSFLLNSKNKKRLEKLLILSNPENIEKTGYPGFFLSRHRKPVLLEWSDIASTFNARFPLSSLIQRESDFIYFLFSSLFRSGVKAKRGVLPNPQCLQNSVETGQQSVS